MMQHISYKILLHSFVFFSFTFNGFKDLTWKIFYDVLERDTQLDRNLMILLKLTLRRYFYASNYKQNVPLALVIFDETTSAAIQSCFPKNSTNLGILKSFQRSLYFEMS